MKKNNLTNLVKTNEVNKHVLTAFETDENLEVKKYFKNLQEGNRKSINQVLTEIPEQNNFKRTVLKNSENEFKNQSKL